MIWDGLVHAWLQDTMVAGAARVAAAWAPSWWRSRAGEARAAGCEWLHVDFDPELRPFYVDACGFTPTDAGLIALQDGDAS